MPTSPTRGPCEKQTPRGLAEEAGERFPSPCHGCCCCYSCSCSPRDWGTSYSRPARSGCRAWFYSLGGWRRCPGLPQPPHGHTPWPYIGRIFNSVSKNSRNSDTSASNSWEKVALLQVGKMAVLLVLLLVGCCVLQGRLLTNDWLFFPRGWRKTWQGSPAAREEIKGWRESSFFKRDWVIFVSLHECTTYD